MKISSRMLPFAVLACALLWGSAFPAIKAIYADWHNAGIEPTMANRFVLAGVRFMIGGAALLMLAKQPLAELRNTSLVRLLAFACAQTYIQYALFYSALAISSAVLGGLLVGSGSIWWLLLAPLLLKSPWPSRQQWGFILVGLAGVVFAVYRPGAGSGQAVLGGILFCLCTLSGAFALIILQKILKTMGPKSATGYGLLFGGILLMLSGVSAWPELQDLFSPKVILLTFYSSLRIRFFFWLMELPDEPVSSELAGWISIFGAGMRGHRIIFDGLGRDTRLRYLARGGTGSGLSDWPAPPWSSRGLI